MLFTQSRRYVFLHLFVTRFQKFKSCLAKLDIVNRTLKKLGISENYAKLRIQTVRLIIGWIISIFLSNIIDYLYLRKYILKSYAIGIPYIANHAIHINTLCDFMYMMLLRFVILQYNKYYFLTKQLYWRDVNKFNKFIL